MIRLLLLVGGVTLLLIGCGESVCVENPYALEETVWSEKVVLDTLIYQDSFRLQIHHSQHEYEGKPYRNYDSISITKKINDRWVLLHNISVEADEFAGYFCMDMNEDWYDDIVVRFYAGTKGFYQDYIFLYNVETKQYDFLGEDYLGYEGSWFTPNRLCLLSNYYHSMYWDLGENSYDAYLWKIEDTSYYPLAEMHYTVQENNNQAYIYNTAQEGKMTLIDSIAIENGKEESVVRMQIQYYWNKNIELLDR